MSKKDREGMSKRQEFRERRRRAQQRTRLMVIGGIVLVVLGFALILILPQLRPVATVVPVTPIAIPDANRNTAGNPNAPVKLTEFSDYQCPFCKRWWSDTEAQVLGAYVKTGKVFFTARSAGNWVSQNSQSGDTESQDSAMAAYCAADQGKFWQMHDALFTNNRDVEDQGSFTGTRLQKIAESVGLDMGAYNSCYSSDKYLNQVNKDLNDATAAGITGTPFFVISYTVNGQAKTDTLDGAQPFSVFQQKLDAALQAAGAK